jgi:branched-chain amino acid transport system permease protein
MNSTNTSPISTSSTTQASALSWAQVARMGAIGGAVGIFLALVGMIEAFATRSILAGIIELGTLLLLLTFFGTGIAATRKIGVASPPMTVLVGLVAGLVASVLVALLAAFINAFPGFRGIFINASPLLVDVMTFRLGVPNGLILLLVAGAISGALAGVLQILPAAFRKSLIYAITVLLVIGLLQDLIRITFQNWTALNPLSAFLFTNNGLTIVGAVTLFILTFAIHQAWQARGKQVQNRLNVLPPSQQRMLGLGANGFAILLLLALPALVGLFFSEVLVNVGLFILLGLGLNIVVGYAGLLDLGYVAFYAIGAYTVGLMTSTSLEIIYAGGNPFWVALPFAILLAVIAGVVLGVPVLKIRGDYLAIVTLGFGEIIRLVVGSDFLKPLLGGSRGIELIPKPTIGSFEFGGAQQLYYLILGGCVLVAFIALRLQDSRLGRAWGAMREDEDVAEAMGINLVNTKLLAFAIGASFGGLSGAIFASKLAIIYPHSFNFLISINVLAVVIIGGMGSIPGVILGALVLVGLPELLREFADFRLLLYGAALIIMMLVRPEGLLPSTVRQRELHEAAEDAATSGPIVADEVLAREGAAG